MTERCEDCDMYCKEIAELEKTHRDLEIEFGNVEAQRDKLLEGMENIYHISNNLT